MNGLRRTERGWEVSLRMGGILYYDNFWDALAAWWRY